MKTKYFILLLLLCGIIAFLTNSDFMVGNAVAGGWCDKIKIDGKSNDWKRLPTLIKARNNLEEYLPAEVGAAISDRVDVKSVKAYIDGEKGRFYFFIRFWGGPVWPNYAYVDEDNGEIWVRHRGYYHLLLDLDNDPSTGWDNRWYEGHYTPLGYYHSQGLRNTRHIGAECYIDLELDSGGMPEDWTGEVWYVGYGGADYREYDGQSDTGDLIEFYWFYVEDAIVEDMAKSVGTVINAYDGEEHWAGHAFGHNFLEYGVSLDNFRQYWADQDKHYFKKNHEIGIAAFIETPIDEWGVDTSPRGTVMVPNLKFKNWDGLAKVNAAFENASVPLEFSLDQNYPNPFNPETEIRFQLPEAGYVTITVYNIIGQEIRTLVAAQYEAGFHNVRWNGKDQNGNDVSSGIYFYKLQAGNFSDIKKMSLIR